MKPTKMHLLSLFATALLLSGCKVTFPDTKECSVAGRIIAGADCAHTGHDEKTEMDAGEFIKFLEDGAICSSREDYGRRMDAIEQACTKLGAGCAFEVKQAIAQAKLNTAMLGKKKK